MLHPPRPHLRSAGPSSPDPAPILTFWLRPDLLCIGRTLRTNDDGARQLAALVGGDVRICDVPYWHGEAELIHLLSVISPAADDLAVVYLPLLPAGLWELLHMLRVRLIAVPDDEFATLGCNVLAVRPGVLIVAEGNPRTAAALLAAGCEVHTYPATEIGLNGSGGPTCMTRPAWLRTLVASGAPDRACSLRAFHRIIVCGTPYVVLRGCEAGCCPDGFGRTQGPLPGCTSKHEMTTEANRAEP